MSKIPWKWHKLIVDTRLPSLRSGLYISPSDSGHVLDSLLYTYSQSSKVRREDAPRKKRKRAYDGLGKDAERKRRMKGPSRDDEIKK